MTFSKNLVRTPIIFGVLVLFVMLFVSQNAFGASTISGTVYDKQRNILSEIDLQLLNDYYQTVARARSDGSGRYQFNGVRDGRYTVRVFAFRYDLEDQDQSVEIITQNIRGGEGSIYFSLDFYLQPRKGGLRDAELSVIFAQEVPKEAEKVYKKAIDALTNKRTTEGILGLSEAIKIFPNYFQALHRLGQELFIKGKYLESAQSFMVAVRVNQRSATSLFYLGYSLHNLGKEYNKAAITALNQAYILAPGSTLVLYVLGKVERAEGKFTEAEKHLLQAEKLAQTKFPDVHKELAQLYANDLKKYKEAANELELYMKASKLTGEDAKKMTKTISDLREKAKTQTSN